MKERPILFSGPMVRAILEGRKTQTRRVVKPPLWWEGHRITGTTPHGRSSRYQDILSSWDGGRQMFCPRGQPGDRLWVKEAFGFDAAYDHVKPRDIREMAELKNRMIETRHNKGFPHGGSIVLAHKADWTPDYVHRWRSSRFMPKWASRLTLEVTGIRVERLQDISEEDARAEGVQCSGCESTEHRHCDNLGQKFRQLWESIHGPGSWDRNPWVWAITFEEIPQAPAQAKPRKVKP